MTGPIRLAVALDGFIDTVVPLLQERGVLRSEYTTRTLREHMGP